MADNQAEKSGVSTKVVRQTVKNSSIFVLLQIKFEEWRKARAGKRWSRKMAQAKAAKALGVASNPKAKPKPKPKAASKLPDPRKDSKKGNRLARILVLVLLLLALLAVWLTAVWYFGWRGDGNGSTVVGSSEATATPTAMATAIPAAVSAEDVYLRVETLQLVNAGRGTWAPIEGIKVRLVYLDRFFPPNVFAFSLEMVWQVTELATTADGVLVAQTTFTVPEGIYWVQVEPSSLPKGCASWAPELATDEGMVANDNGWKIVGLSSRVGYNTAVVKFQIICGLDVAASPTTVAPESTPVPTNPPKDTPPPGPTDPPPTNPPPTDPPPTDPPPTDPPPTPVPTVVDCNCETPESPVPTPEYEATATPTR